MEDLKEKFHKLRLMPKDKELWPQFTLYRLKDVQKMSHFEVLVFLLQNVLNIYQFSTEPSSSAFLQLLPPIIIWLFLLTIWLLRKKLLRQMPNLLTIALALKLAMFVFGTPMAIAVMPPEIQELNQATTVRTQFANCYRAMGFMIIVGTPSVLYLITHITMYLIAILCISLLKGDLNDPIFIESLKTQPANVVGISLIFIMLQERELRRFNDQIRMGKANSQVRGIFNMSSDAIIVVKKQEPKVEDKQDVESPKLIDPPQCLYSNGKSVELFKQDLTKIYTPNQKPVLKNEDLLDFEFVPTKLTFKQTNLDTIYLQADKSYKLEELMHSLFVPLDQDIETYQMVDTVQQSGQEQPQKTDRILCLKRIDLMFDNVHCQAISFIDISPYAQLKKQEEQNNVLKALNMTVHHEMLSPLRANIEISQILYQSIKEQRIKKLAQILYASSRLLLSHAQDLLDQQTIENNRFTPNYVDGSIISAIQEIFQLVRLCNTDKQKLQIKHYTKIGPIEVKFDRHRFQQVLLNLLSNATKFQDEGVIKIYSSIKLVEDDSFVNVVVADKGLGMNMAQLADVFKPVLTDSNRQRNQSKQISNGVGLSICKKICQELGGDITVQSTLGKGTKFQFRMLIPQSDSNPVAPNAREIQQQAIDESFELVDESDVEAEEQKAATDDLTEISLVEQGNQKELPLQEQLKSNMIESNQGNMEYIADRNQIFTGQQLSSAEYSFFESFLAIMQANGLLDAHNDTGCILYADDQFINRQFLQHTLSILQLSERFHTYPNGQMVLDAFDRILDIFADFSESDETGQPLVIQPVAILFLDINMPVLDGLQTSRLIKQRVEDFNARMRVSTPLLSVVRPLIVHLTQYDNSFKQFIKEEEQADLYLQKPISSDDLRALLKRLKIL